MFIVYFTSLCALGCDFFTLFSFLSICVFARLVFYAHFVCRLVLGICKVVLCISLIIFTGLPCLIHWYVLNIVINGKIKQEQGQVLSFFLNHAVKRSTITYRTYSNRICFCTTISDTKISETICFCVPQSLPRFLIDTLISVNFTHYFVAVLRTK